MAGKQNPYDQDPFMSTDWGFWDTENPYASTDFTTGRDIAPEDWW